MTSSWGGNFAGISGQLHYDYKFFTNSIFLDRPHFFESVSSNLGGDTALGQDEKSQAQNDIGIFKNKGKNWRFFSLVWLIVI